MNYIPNSMAQALATTDLAAPSPLADDPELAAAVAADFQVLLDQVEQAHQQMQADAKNIVDFALYKARHQSD